MGCCNEKLEGGKAEVLVGAETAQATIRTQPAEELFWDISLETPPRYSFTQQSDCEHIDSGLYVDPCKSSEYFISKVTKRVGSRDFSAFLDKSSLSLSREDANNTTLPRASHRCRVQNLSLDSRTSLSSPRKHKTSMSIANHPHLGDETVNSPRGSAKLQHRSVSSIGKTKLQESDAVDWMCEEQSVDSSL